MVLSLRLKLKYEWLGPKALTGAAYVKRIM